MVRRILSSHHHHISHHIIRNCFVCLLRIIAYLRILYKKRVYGVRQSAAVRWISIIYIFRRKFSFIFLLSFPCSFEYFVLDSTKNPTISLFRPNVLILGEPEDKKKNTITHFHHIFLLQIAIHQKKRLRFDEFLNYSRIHGWWCPQLPSMRDK